jgi:hypothetical protein
MKNIRGFSDVYVAGWRRRWAALGNILAAFGQQIGSFLATFWQLTGSRLATSWQLFGSKLAASWRQMATGSARHRRGLVGNRL